jgi:CO/xanthine dehydrogenase Mo-binding subunit
MRASQEIFIEPERYELVAAPMYNFRLRRRTFFKVLGGGVLVVALVRQAAAQESGRGGRRGGRSRPQELGAWLHIGEDGAIQVFTGKAEVGQDIRTSLTQVVAEELGVPATSIRVVMADTQLTPYDAGTFGSRTTPDMAVQLRRVAASAREVLIDLAVEQGGGERDAYVVEDGRVRHSGSGRAFPFGTLTKGQKLMKTVAAEAATTPAAKWKVAGTSVRKIDGADFVSGKHKYVSDLNLPGMLHGKVLRPATLGGKVVSVDAAQAKALPGVTVVQDGEFIGVAAPDVLSAERAAKAIRAEWKSDPQIANAQLFDHLKKTARGGAVNPPPAPADRVVQRTGTYTIAYIAHAPLEPRAAVAEWKDDRITVWTGTQRPFGVRSELAQAFRIPEDRVRVIVPDTGSGYGGKHTGEAAVEAARIAKAAGKPVKLVWTREEEFTWAYFRPAGVIDVTGAVNADGKLTAWEFHNYNSGGSGIRMLYDVPNPKTEFHGAQSPLRQGSYRALASTANHFARESHIDDLADAAKLDPVEFRMKNLKEPRLRAVLQAAAEKFQWGKAKPDESRGFGIALGFEKGSYVATAAEVKLDRNAGRISVVRVVQAFECGAVLNPDHLINQNEGSIVMGLGGALFESIRFENGRILNPRFSEYRVPRFSDLPKIEIVLVHRKDLPSTGAGETPIIGIAPAIGNAVFSATNTRLRSLPMTLKA